MTTAAGAGPRPAQGFTVLFGTSANPPTGLEGHAGLVRWASQLRGAPELGGGDVAAVWVLPVYQHAFADKREMVDFEDRLALARLAFEAPEVGGQVRVLDAERTLALARPGQPTGTADLVRALRRDHPQRRFCLLLGADTYRDLKARRWRQSDWLLCRLPILVVPRAGQPIPAEAASRPPPLSAISSSAVRASDQAAFLRQALQPQVLQFIRARGLYRSAQVDWAEAG